MSRFHSISYSSRFICFFKKNGSNSDAKENQEGGNVHDARRFVVHEKSPLNHKARTHGFDIKTPTMHRHKMKDTIPRNQTLTSSAQHSNTALLGFFLLPVW